MRRFTWLLWGIVLGFVAAHFVNKSPEGKRFFERINQGAREFSDAVQHGYREAETEAEESLDHVERALKQL